MGKLTRYEIENIVSSIMNKYNYGDCYPDEVLHLENRAQIENINQEDLENELNQMIYVMDLEEK